MTSADFYKQVKEHLKGETDDGNQYAMLAKEAPEQWQKDILMCMARDELMHKAHLEGMLLGHMEG